MNGQRGDFFRSLWICFIFDMCFLLMCVFCVSGAEQRMATEKISWQHIALPRHPLYLYPGCATHARMHTHTHTQMHSIQSDVYEYVHAVVNLHLKRLVAVNKLRIYYIKIHTYAHTRLDVTHSERRRIKYLKFSMLFPIFLFLLMFLFLFIVFLYTIQCTVHIVQPVCCRC